MSGTLLQRLAAALVSRPFVYDLVQNLAGQARVAERLRGVIEPLARERVLDVGSAGGGLSARLGIHPLCVDLDLRPLLAMRRRRRASVAVAGDITRLPFPGSWFDLTLCVMVFHHLDEVAAAGAIEELARVTRGRLVFLEPIDDRSRRISRWLWHYDRGRHPRTREQIVERMERCFRIEKLVDFSVYHRYVLCLAEPRR